VNKHLKKKHNIPIDGRRKVVNILKNQKPLLLDPSKALLRPNESLYNPNLPLFDRFSCKFCDLLAISSQVIGRHVSAEHERQRLELYVKPKAMYDPVYLQAWSLVRLIASPPAFYREPEPEVGLGLTLV
jgi:hypothetical protein